LNLSNTNSSPPKTSQFGCVLRITLTSCWKLYPSAIMTPRFAKS